MTRKKPADERPALEELLETLIRELQAHRQEMALLRQAMEPKSRVERFADKYEEILIAERVKEILAYRRADKPDSIPDPPRKDHQWDAFDDLAYSVFVKIADEHPRNNPASDYVFDEVLRIESDIIKKRETDRLEWATPSMKKNRSCTRKNFRKRCTEYKKRYRRYRAELSKK